jgi:hypothetical protein
MVYGSSLQNKFGIGEMELHSTESAESRRRTRRKPYSIVSVLGTTQIIEKAS